MRNRNYWLVKSEPTSYSYDDLQNEPEQTAEWDGVRNFQARNNLRRMQLGDGVLFYHSNAKPSAIVGLATVAAESYPDHTAWDPNSDHPDPKSTPEAPIWYMVDVKASASLKLPISLDVVKSTPGLENMMLLKNSRLSVQSVTVQEWEILMEISEFN